LWLPSTILFRRAFRSPGAGGRPPPTSRLFFDKRRVLPCRVEGFAVGFFLVTAAEARGVVEKAARWSVELEDKEVVEAMSSDWKLRDRHREHIDCDMAAHISDGTSHSTCPGMLNAVVKFGDAKKSLPLPDITVQCSHCCPQCMPLYRLPESVGQPVSACSRAYTAYVS
jgi:hypothetical protein